MIKIGRIANRIGIGAVIDITILSLLLLLLRLSFPKHALHISSLTSSFPQNKTDETVLGH
jgi:hypothetical protein